MKYNYKEGAEKRKNRKLVAFPIIGLLGGAYLLANVLSPAIPSFSGPADSTAKKLVSLAPDTDENRVYVPKINIDVPVVPIEDNEAIALEKGAVQRSPTSGNPKDGGNYVVTAHRFNLGITPWQTRSNSPFYHLAKLSAGDDIYVDYDGVRYAYKVEERKIVAPTDEAIEARTDDDRLTIYSSELVGSGTDREIVVAKPVGKIVWTNGKPKLQSL